MENLFWIGFIGAIIAGLFAVTQAKKVMSYSEGTERMQKIAANIRSGANAYLKQQYTTVFKVFVVVFIALLVMAFATGGQMLSGVFFVEANIKICATKTRVLRKVLRKKRCFARRMSVIFG